MLSKVKFYTSYLLLFSFIPLLTGLLIYFLSGSKTIITDYISECLGFQLKSISTDSSILLFFRNYICDFLWAFAVESLVILFLIEMNIKYPGIVSVIISLVFSIFIEVSPQLGLFHGTFDKYDIIFEIFAIIFSLKISNGFLRRFRNE